MFHDFISSHSFIHDQVQVRVRVSAGGILRRTTDGRGKHELIHASSVPVRCAAVGALIAVVDEERRRALVLGRAVWSGIIIITAVCAQFRFCSVEDDEHEMK